MHKKLLTLVLALGMALAAMSPALAHEYDRNDSGHPFRYFTYVVHPVGVALEYLVARPIHWLVSQPTACVIFGHRPTAEDGNYMEWRDPAKELQARQAQ